MRSLSLSSDSRSACTIGSALVIEAPIVASI